MFCFCLALYGFGLLLAGVLTAFSGTRAQRFLQYFAAALLAQYTSGTVLHLFSTLFLAAAFLLILLLLLGFCAFGAPLIAALLMAKGIGSGVLIRQFFASFGWKGLLLYMLLMALPDLLLSFCLCLLGRDAMRSASALLHGLQNSTAPQEDTHMRYLVRRCLRLCLLQILSCGLTAAVCPLLIKAAEKLLG